ncbi:MAG: carboxypeptidase-like regulatory domain-containing protein [Bacteroidota bacterium]
MTRTGTTAGALCVLLAVCLMHIEATAGTTGKIAGRATDKDTHEPLVGVNMAVEGTTLGAPTDADGNFVILNVPPGTYRVKASLVGYAPLVVTDVTVKIDQTTTVNVDLGQQAIEAGEVVITAERKAVQRDVSTSVASVTSDEVRSLPVTSVAEVATLQAGVEGGLVIRGGAADQSLFLLDGVTLRDPRNNQPIASVPISAVKEVNIERGGFNAEYGQLQAGIINVVTREGKTGAYTVSFTGRYGPPGNKYFGISPFNPNSMWLRPFLDPAVAWSGTRNGAWDIYMQRQYPQFDGGWNAVSEQMFAAGDPRALTPAAAQRLFAWQHRKRDDPKAPDYNLDFGIGGPLIPITSVSEDLGNLRFFLSFRNQREMLLVPLSLPDYYEDVWSLRLTSDIAKSMKLDVTGTIGRSLNVAPNDVESLGSFDFLRSPDRISQDFSLQPASVEARLFLDSYYSVANVRHGSLAAQFTHVLSPTAFYEVRLEHLYRTYNTGPVAPRDTTARYELFPGYFVDEAPFGFDPINHVGINGMWMGGHTSTTRDNSRISATTLKGSLTVQLDRYNQVKAGAEMVYNDLQLDYGYVSVQFPNENDTVDIRRTPIRAALYVEDKLEFEGWVANLGLRADYSNARTEWPQIDPFSKSFFGGNNPGIPYPTTASTARFELSPRLGISHPITEDSKLFFNYGHFRQLPTYEQLLRQSRGAGGAVKQFGNPSLPMSKTIAYELGYDHSLFDNTYLIQVAAFYRDISDQQGFTEYVSGRNGVDYFQVNTNNYQDIRGFELTLRKTRGPWVYGFLNYTYQAVSGGFFDKAVVSDDPTQQIYFDQTRNNYPQYRSIPTPFARTSITLFTPHDLGSPDFMQYLAADWSLTLLGDWRSGYYVSWHPKISASIPPNLQTVDWWNLNLRLSKTIPLGPLQLTLLMDMTNVFNTRRLNLNAFYDPKDQQYYFESLHLPASNAYDNIPGSDRPGDFRKDGVPYQPMEWTVLIGNVQNPLPNVIYYEKSTGRYMNFLNNQWSEVDPARLQQVLDDKAYIDMPNMTSFTFLNPRNIFYGITATVEF